MNARQILVALKRHADPKKAAFLPTFFKTGKGDYGEGDVFFGISVPDLRRLSKTYVGLSRTDIATLLRSRYHEARLLGLLILVLQYQRGSSSEKSSVVEFYCRQFQRINNWDLVDTTAPYILGDYLLHHPRGELLRYARSGHLWTERIAIVSTFAFIRAGEFEDTLRIAEIFLTHDHDLIHKATGWMLREVGKRDADVLREFLQKHARRMPRTMLRYAIERLSDVERARWMNRERS